MSEEGEITKIEDDTRKKRKRHVPVEEISTAWVCTDHEVLRGCMPGLAVSAKDEKSARIAVEEYLSARGMKGTEFTVQILPLGSVMSLC